MTHVNIPTIVCLTIFGAAAAADIAFLNYLFLVKVARRTSENAFKTALLGIFVGFIGAAILSYLFFRQSVEIYISIALLAAACGGFLLGWYAYRLFMRGNTPIPEDGDGA
jgi:H+/Cl- antiporter ClcA